MIAPARLAAYDVLQAVDAGRADLPASLAHVRARLPDERDRALAGEIATGTLRWRGAIDHVVAEFAQREPARLDAEVLTILRLGIFQLLHLDRVPAAAVVDDAVEMTRKAGKRSASGFVNALLRRASRERDRLPLPPPPGPHASRDERLAFLSVTSSHPRWLADRWMERYGFEQAVAWTAFNNAPAPLTLRANTARGTRDEVAEELGRYGVETAPVAFAPNGLKVVTGNPLLTPLAHTGRFLVQDEASQLVGEFVAAQPGAIALDTCASPGGKTLQIAAAPGRRRVVACDVRGRRVALLARTIAEAGAHVRIVQADARGALPFAAVFDLVLVDAPCSGLGTIRRDPDIKWRRQPGDLPDLASAQGAMLAGAAATVRPGGRLIYATCSSEPEENDAVVETFLDRHPGWESMTGPLPRPAGWLSRFLDDRARLRTLPFRDGLEAFFAAALVKRQDLR